jgi:hypothetical protein
MPGKIQRLTTAQITEQIQDLSPDQLADCLGYLSSLANTAKHVGDSCSAGILSDCAGLVRSRLAEITKTPLPADGILAATDNHTPRRKPSI